jgi:hypothetical protein
MHRIINRNVFRILTWVVRSYRLIVFKQAYCHVSGVPWLIIAGSGLDNWIYWRLLLQSLLITITTLIINNCLRLAPFLTKPRVSSLLLWLGSRSLLLRLTYESLRTKDNEEWITCPPLNSRRTAYLQQFLYYPVRICCCGNVPSKPLSSNGRLCGASLHTSGVQASCHNIVVPTASTVACSRMQNIKINKPRPDINLVVVLSFHLGHVVAIYRSARRRIPG